MKPNTTVHPKPEMTAEEFARESQRWLVSMGLMSHAEAIAVRYRTDRWVGEWERDEKEQAFVDSMRKSGGMKPVEIDTLALLDQAQAQERELRQKIDEMQSLLSRIRKVLLDWGVERQPQECMEAWLQRSLMPAAIEKRAAELAKDGFLPVVSRCRNDWYCQLNNMTLGFYPGGSGTTAMEAIESAAKHPLVREVLK